MRIVLVELKATGLSDTKNKRASAPFPGR